MKAKTQIFVSRLGDNPEWIELTKLKSIGTTSDQYRAIDITDLKSSYRNLIMDEPKLILRFLGKQNNLQILIPTLDELLMFKVITPSKVRTFRATISKFYRSPKLISISIILSLCGEVLTVPNA